MGRFSRIHVIRITVGISVSCCAGLDLREHFIVFFLIRTEYSNGYRGIP